jgi:oxygen-dependent protoporphyrinogen oxidase
LQAVPHKIGSWIRSHWKEALVELTSKRVFADETVYDFFSRKFSQDFAEQYIDPLCSGIFADDPKNLSMQACFPYIWERQLKDRSLILSMLYSAPKPSRMVSFKKGLETLTQALSAGLTKELRYKSEVLGLVFSHQKASIFTEQGKEDFDAVVSSLPSYVLKKLMPDRYSPDIVHNSVGVVHLGYKEDVLTYPGFGYLVPRREKQNILGVIFDSKIFPQHNQSPEQTRLTVMMDKEPSIDQAKEQIRKHLGIHLEPEVACSHFLKQAIPRYEIGYLAAKQKYLESAKQYPNLIILGTSYAGVSLNAAISAAMEGCLDSGLLAMLMPSSIS